MAEQLRKRIEALKSRKAAVEESSVARQSSSTVAALSPSSVNALSSFTQAAGALPAPGKSNPSVSLANLPPAFVSPYAAVVRYRDTVKDPLCVEFTTKVAVDLFKEVLHLRRQRQCGGIEMRRHKRARSERPEIADGAAPLSDSDSVVANGEHCERRNEEEEEGRPQLSQHSTREGEPLGGFGGGNNNDVHLNHSPVCTAVSYFLPYLESRCFTPSEVQGRERKVTHESCPLDAYSPVNVSASSSGTNAKRSTVTGIQVSGKLRPPCRSVNEYIPVGQIAHGVYGIVYKAVEACGSTNDGEGTSKMGGSRKFALKQVKQQWLGESEVGFPPYLLREFDLLLRLRHPNIVCGREVVLLDKRSDSPGEAEPQEIIPAVAPNMKGDDNEGSHRGRVSDSAGATKKELPMVSNGTGGNGPVPSSTEDSVKADEEPPHIKKRRLAKKMRDVYLVMEYCPYDLKAFIYHRRGVSARLHLSSRNNHPDAPRCFLSRAKCIMQQLFTGLAFLHDHRVLHRDIKTSNILISSSGEVKLCDFGLGRHYREGQDLTSNVVTLMYRAPELHFGITDYSYKMDVWSLACIMAEIFLKEPLFRAEEESRHFAVICDIIGIPTEETFSGLYKIPELTRIMRSLKRYNRENTLQQMFSHSNHRGAATLPPSGLDLLNRILRWNPMDRLSAREALQHPFFHEDPLPCAPAELLAPFPGAVTAEEGVAGAAPPPGRGADAGQTAEAAAPMAGELKACEEGNGDAYEFDGAVRCDVGSPSDDAMRARAGNVDEEIGGESLRTDALGGSAGCTSCDMVPTRLKEAHLLANHDNSPEV